MPASIKLQQEWGDDLQVIFVESQGADLTTAEAFAWKQKWMGTRAMWTTERPVDVEGNSLPKFALISVEGEVLLSGNPLAMKKQIETAIAEQVEKAKAAPTGTPAALKKAWSAFAKGDLAAALAECDKVAAAGGANGEAAGGARAEIERRIESRIARGGWLLEHGFVAEAESLLSGLQKSLKAQPGLLAKVEELQKKLADPALAAEREAAKSLASVEQKMKKDKPFEDGNVKALERLAEKYAGTKSAERAAHLASLAKHKASG